MIHRHLCVNLADVTRQIIHRSRFGQTTTVLRGWVYLCCVIGQKNRLDVNRADKSLTWVRFWNYSRAKSLSSYHVIGLSAGNRYQCFRTRQHFCFISRRGQEEESHPTPCESNVYSTVEHTEGNPVFGHPRRGNHTTPHPYPS